MIICRFLFLGSSSKSTSATSGGYRKNDKANPVRRHESVLLSRSVIKPLGVCKSHSDTCTANGRDASHTGLCHGHALARSNPASPPHIRVPMGAATKTQASSNTDSDPSHYLNTSLETKEIDTNASYDYNANSSLLQNTDGFSKGTPKKTFLEGISQSNPKVPRNPDITASTCKTSTADPYFSKVAAIEISNKTVTTEAQNDHYRSSDINSMLFYPMRKAKHQLQKCDSTEKNSLKRISACSSSSASDGAEPASDLVDSLMDGRSLFGCSSSSHLYFSRTNRTSKRLMRTAFATSKACTPDKDGLV